METYFHPCIQVDFQLLFTGKIISINPGSISTQECFHQSHFFLVKNSYRQSNSCEMESLSLLRFKDVDLKCGHGNFGYRQYLLETIISPACIVLWSNFASATQKDGSLLNTIGSIESSCTILTRFISGSLMTRCSIATN